MPSSGWDVWPAPSGGPGRMLVHERLWGHGLGGRRGRPWDLPRERAVGSPGRVRAAGVVMSPPALDHDLGFRQRVEHLAVEQLVAELAVEAQAIAVLPSTAELSIR